MDIKVISREWVVVARFASGEAPDTQAPYTSVVIRPQAATLLFAAGEGQEPRLQKAVLDGQRVNKNSLGAVHDATYYPSTLPDWLAPVTEQAKGVIRG